MHSDDFREIVNALQGIVWLLRANLTLILVFFLFVVTFPVQLVRWILSKQTFTKTEPYQFLRYVFVKGTAFDWELPSNLSYEEWKRNPPR